MSNVRRRCVLQAGLTGTTLSLAGCGATSESPTTTEGDAETATTERGTTTGQEVSSRRRRWVARHGMTASEYQDRFDTYVGEGLRLTDVTGYEVDGEARYAALWQDLAGPAWVARHGLTASEFQSQVGAFGGQGYRLTHVSGYAIGNEDRYAAIWQQFSGSTWHAHHRLSPSAYQNAFGEYLDEGLRLTDVSGYEVDGEPRYAAIWQQFSGPTWHAHHGLSASNYQAKFDEYLEKGHRLVSVSGYSIGGESRFASLWKGDDFERQTLDRIDSEIGEYARKHGVPGLSLAISKDERLVFARGYGYANRAARERVRPSHRFRIASVSKPITAVATMTLVESGDLRLDDPVFGTDGVLGTAYGTPIHGYTESDDYRNVTVQHLLQHTSGWTTQGGDPMFMHPDKSKAELAQWVLDNRELQNEPGEKMVYLNFGYSLLGLVIEAVSGKAYDEYVKEAVLEPCGISRMEIAGDTRPERKSDEVVYYGGNPYGMPVARMDGHGGWIATATDLLRFVVRVDGFTNKTDIIEPVFEAKSADSERPKFGYRERWMLRGDWRGHNGAFDGTVGYLVRRDDGVSFAVLANTRPSSDLHATELRRRIDTAIDDVSAWPSHDLF